MSRVEELDPRRKHHPGLCHPDPTYAQVMGHLGSILVKTKEHSVGGKVLYPTDGRGDLKIGQ